jgi:hypothetical protein
MRVSGGLDQYLYQIARRIRTPFKLSKWQAKNTGRRLTQRMSAAASGEALSAGYIDRAAPRSDGRVVDCGGFENR